MLPLIVPIMQLCNLQQQRLNILLVALQHDDQFLCLVMRHITLGIFDQVGMFVSSVLAYPLVFIIYE